MPGNNNPSPQPTYPNLLGPFGWSPITFNGIGVSGQMQVILYADGGYIFSGQFYDPDMLDYDDSLAVVVAASNGVAFTFAHTGSMQGWCDRWLEGGSNTDSWNLTGNNPSIQANWAALCAEYNWQSNASINADLASVLTDVEDLVKAIQAVVQIVEVVAA